MFINVCGTTYILDLFFKLGITFDSNFLAAL